jgi:REP element-mobilizing transposase RayT
MPRYVANENLPYFCTITVLDWLPVLIESRYIEPLLDSLRFCRQHKGLRLYAFVVMPNHLHLICSADGAGVRADSRASEAKESGARTDSRTSTSGECGGNPLHDVMRDFKRFTSRQIHDRLKEDGRTTVLEWLRHATQRARRERGELGLWQDGFHPQALWSAEVVQQKLDYVHANPCRKGLVERPEQWWFSSAAHYAGERTCCLDLDPLDL